METANQTGAVTLLLRAWGRGDLRARDELVPVVYRELRRRAGGYLRRERRDNSLQPTGAGPRAVSAARRSRPRRPADRAHFFGVAAQMMRRILIDHARERHAAKRSGAAIRVILDDRIGAAQPLDCEMIMLDGALNELTCLDARQGQIVELRYFGGLSEEEVATVLSVSRRTVTREWRAARA